MRFVFLAPLPSAFGEALHGARLASALVARGHVVQFAAPSILQPTVPDGIPYAALDAALPRLDVEIEALCLRVRADVLVLVDASAVDKVCRAFGLSRERIATAAPRVVSIDCWNLVEPPRSWDYGPVSEPLDPWLLEHTAVIRPAPIARAEAPGAYAALPVLAAPTSTQRAETRRRFGLAEGRPLIVWPTARWQLPDSHDNPALARVAARLPALVAPALATLGDEVDIAHVTPRPLTTTIASYRAIAPLPAAGFEALIGAADVVLSFNAAATSLATAVSLGVPTALCAARDPAGAEHKLWAWPLSLEQILEPTVRDHPFYATMSLVESLAGDELVAALRALLFDPSVRDERRAAQARYRDAIATLPDGVDLLLNADG